MIPYMTDNRKKALQEEYSGGATIKKSLLTVSEMKEVIAETQLTDVERKIVEMRYLEGKTFKEIADEIGYDVRTVQRKAVMLSPRLCETTLKIIYS